MTVAPACHAVFCDGHAVFLRDDTDVTLLRALVTYNGGEPAALPE